MKILNPFVVSKSLLAALVFSLCAASTSEAKMSMSSLWGDDMVIQRQAEVKFMGSSDKVSTPITLTASWDGKTYKSETDAQGNWSVLVNTPDAGGPYTVTISDGDEFTLKDVLLGDVWLCMGQSNMECDMRGYGHQPVKGSAKYISQAKESAPIRLFTTVVAAATQPVMSPEGKWLKTNSKTVSEFSALGYMFGYGLQRDIDVPVGLMSVNMGGSDIITWMRRDWLAEAGEYNYTLEEGVGTNEWAHKKEEYLYNGMVASLKDYSVKGCLWYQGETNSDRYEEYTRLFPAFVKGLRGLLKSGEFPVYYVQIAPYDEYTPNMGVLMREAMGRLMALSPRTGMVPTTDVGEQYIVHPRYKQEVADRLLLWALGDTYGREGFSYRAPEYAGMTVVKRDKSEQKCIGIKFNHAPFGLMWSDKAPSNLFEIAGEDKVFHPAQAQINIYGGEYPLQVWSEEVPEPVAVRYAFKNYVEGIFLYNTSGVPVSSFRSDDWKL